MASLTQLWEGAADADEAGAEAGICQSTRDPGQGHLVVVIARWILVLTGLALTLWNPAGIGELRTQLLVILLLAVANFFLHAQLLRRRPVADALAYGASAADLAVITLLVAVQGGFDSNLYAFYFTALLALSVAFPPSSTLGFTGAAMLLYVLVGVITYSGRLDSATMLTVAGRLIIMAAVAVCGGVYRRLEADRLVDRGTGSRAQEASEDVFFGQVVLIWARWFVILAGAILTLWSSDTSADLARNIIPIVVLMGMNFFLHARYVLERPANALLIKLISGLDLVVITTIVLTWSGQRGLESQLFIYYYPVILAFAFVFKPRLAGTFTGAALVAYAAACLLADWRFVTVPSDLKLLAVRLVTLASMGALGTCYWRAQREWERARRHLPSEHASAGAGVAA